MGPKRQKGETTPMATKNQDTEWKLGPYLLRYRRAKNLSARQAAKKAGISDGRWRQVENGYQSIAAGQTIPVMPKPETLFKMLRALDAPVEEGMQLVGYQLSDYPWLTEEAATTEATDKQDDLTWFSSLPRSEREELLGKLQRLHIELEVAARAG